LELVVVIMVVDSILVQVIMVEGSISVVGVIMVEGSISVVGVIMVGMAVAVVVIMVEAEVETIKIVSF
jgi:hypothetical protein